LSAVQVVRAGSYAPPAFASTSAHSKAS
jgi:hypothetical protein